MKTFYSLLAVLLVSSTLNAQIINIPDANFKNALVNTNCVSSCFGSSPDMDADTNNDGEISVSEAQAVFGLHLNGQSISSLDGIENFTNLYCLFVNNNSLTSLDVNAFSNLSTLNCDDNQLTNLVINDLFNLSTLSCNNNQLTDLQIIDTDGLLELYCDNNQLDNLNLIDVSSLTVLSCNQNQLSNLNVNNLLGLGGLYCSQNQLTNLDISNLDGLSELACSQNQLTSLNVDNIDFLFSLDCSDNLLTSLDLSKQRTPLYNFNASNNQLTTLFLKNGIVDTENVDEPSDIGTFIISNNPNLSFICADEFEASDIATYALLPNSITNCLVNSYCSFEPGGDFYTIEGNVVIDFNGNGCDTNDDIYPNLKLSIDNGNEIGYVVSDTSGNYSIPIQEGNYTITPIAVEDHDLFNITPSSINVSFPTDDSPFVQDFCVDTSSVTNDLEILLIPTSEARPGFDAHYKLIYKNKGNLPVSGHVEFIISDILNASNFISATPTEDSVSGDVITWNFIDLEPFETRDISISLSLNTPTDPVNPLNAGDILSYNALIFPVENDETPSNNASSLRQSVVNSFDPNDKTCLEGDIISLDQVGDFVHYLIRFENTGTANAINVIIKDNIDRTKYDLSTLIPINASHDFVTRITDNISESFVEFIFEDINLPFDDANNDGYVVFKIRTLDTLVLGDTFENDAEIYFDFNFPIITNNEQTTVSTLSTEDFELADGIVLYPNPTNDILHIEAKQVIKQISIYDISGRLIQNIAVLGNKTQVHISTEALNSGTYFIKIGTNTNEVVRKVIKN